MRGESADKMYLDKLIKKAKKLLKSRRVEALGEGTYNVIGDHGTYTVVQDYRGRISCNCPGFAKKRRCSHSLAVLMFVGTSRKEKDNISNMHQT